MIGAGNMATRLAIAFHDKGIKILQVFGRTASSAKALAERVGADFSIKINQLNPGADIYIIAVNDDAVAQVASKLHLPGKVVAHTSGSVPMSALNASGARTGVFYPLQTMTRDKEVDFSKVPVCIESDEEEVRQTLLELARLISDNVHLINSEQRSRIHLAAVFVNNFSNHMMAIAEDMLDNQGLDFDILRPLIEETFHKILSASPSNVQTGPAMRDDRQVMEKHLALLSGKERDIYKMLTESIQEFHNIRGAKT